MNRIEPRRGLEVRSSALTIFQHQKRKTPYQLREIFVSQVHYYIIEKTIALNRHIPYNHTAGDNINLPNSELPFLT